MARYFFELRNGDRIIGDDDGTELDGPDEVRGQVMQALPAIAAQHIRNDGDHADLDDGPQRLRSGGHARYPVICPPAALSARQRRSGPRMRPS